MNKKIIPLVAILLSLAGCVTLPGSDLKTANKIVDRDPNTNEVKGVQQLNKYLASTRLYYITPTLIQRQANLRKTREEYSKRNKVLLSTSRDGYQYLIGDSDVLLINVWGQETLTSDKERRPLRVLVDARGRIYYPNVGELYVRGKTTPEVRRIIARKLKKYIESPQVEVQMASFESKRVYVSGAVNRPGVLKIGSSPLTVADAINLSGGLSARAKQNEVTLNRNGQKYPVPLQKILQEGRLDYNYVLQDNDILNVSDNAKDKVYVMGAVIRPQTVQIAQTGLSLTGALSAVGGINEKIANASGIFVIRKAVQDPLENSDVSQLKSAIYQLDITDSTALALGEKFVMQPGDIVYVTTAKISQWSSMISDVNSVIYGTNGVKQLFK